MMWTRVLQVTQAQQAASPKPQALSYCVWVAGACAKFLNGFPSVISWNMLYKWKCWIYHNGNLQCTGILLGFMCKKEDGSNRKRSLVENAGGQAKPCTWRSTCSGWKTMDWSAAIPEAEINSSIPSITLLVVAIDTLSSKGIPRPGSRVHCAIGLKIYCTIKTQVGSNQSRVAFVAVRGDLAWQFEMDCSHWNRTTADLHSTSRIQMESQAYKASTSSSPSYTFLSLVTFLFRSWCHYCE